MRGAPKSIRNAKRRDERFEGLKRRVVHLARLDGAVVHLAEGPCIVQLRSVVDARLVLTELVREGMLRRATLTKAFALATEPMPLDASAIAAGHRDVRALAQKPALALARENRRALARFGTIDASWLSAKEQKLDRASKALRGTPRTAADWFESAVELVAALHGPRDATRLRDAGERLRALPAERRQRALDRLEVIVRALAADVPPEDPDLARLAERLDAVRELPGRARRRRVLDHLRSVVEWSGAPSELVEEIGRRHEITRAEYASLIADAGRSAAARLPNVRDVPRRENALAALARIALLFRMQEEEEDASMPFPFLDEDEDGAERDKRLEDLYALAPAAKQLTLARALAILELPVTRAQRAMLARLVGEGFDLDLAREVVAKKLVARLENLHDLRLARAYATWATRLAAHYEAQGLKLDLSPELFTHLPRNEDLAVLSLCLMEQLDGTKGEGKPGADPIAILDVTLGLFAKLPAKARRILKRLETSPAGAGKRHAPDFAAWLGDDALLDRYVHVAELAGQSPLLSSAIREDFEHAERARRELAHLSQLAKPSVPQQGRLDALKRSARTLAGSPVGRTKRRMAERIERLLPLAYRRELDGTFREIMREAWGIDMPVLDQAWRDAVRFWLVVGDNRDLLGRLLREASAGRPAKDAFEANATWIAQARRQMVVDAWLAPRRETITRGDNRWTIALEEDPLEVLRMGIPFGTCLSLDNGSNAASTVMNAIDANKRVLYVRNEAGKVIARKLLAIAKDFRLLGYNLYVSIAGEDELALRAAVGEFCRRIARDARIPLASTGAPEQLHRGFWYDDGTVSFDEDFEASDYLRALDLPPPPVWWDGLATEAAGWRACQRGDSDAAVAALTAWDSGPANLALGAWLVERLGARTCEKLGAEDTSVFAALVRSLAAEGEAGLVRAFEVAGRALESQAHHRIAPLVKRFPPSLRIATAYVELANLSVKRSHHPTEYGPAHVAFRQLPPLFEDVASSLDLLDAIAPAWDDVVRAIKTCASCRDEAHAYAADVIEAIYDRSPDPDVVTGALASRHRGIAAQRAALRIAARHVLPGGARALVRFAALRPDLARSADGAAALLRQGAPRALEPIEAPFEAMRDLVLDPANQQPIADLAQGFVTPQKLDDWKPGPWELAWRRRVRDEPLRDRLFARAERTPHRATRALELLALLGDLERVKRVRRILDRDAKPTSVRSPFVGASAKDLDMPVRCEATAGALALQVAAERRGELLGDETGGYRDAGYLELARRMLVSDLSDDDTRSRARAVVLAERGRDVIDWHRLLDQVATAGDGVSAGRILEERSAPDFCPLPRAMALAWQLPDARAGVATALAKLVHDDWAARVWAIEREAAARGLDAYGLLDAVALRVAANGQHDEAVDVETADQLREIAGALVEHAPPTDVAAVLFELSDVRAVSIFVRAFRRQPVVRQAAIRQELLKLDLSKPRHQALDRWLAIQKPTGLRGVIASSIERTP